MNKIIHITSIDKKRILQMINNAKIYGSKHNNLYLDALKSEIDAAIIVDPKEIPHNTVTMNSLVRLIDLNLNEELVYSIVYPEDENLSKNMMSVLNPIGTAVIGFSVGDTIEWDVPEGKLKLLIEEIIYQPETYGHFHL